VNPLLDPPAWIWDPAHRFLTRAGSEPGVRWLRAVVWLLVALTVLAFLVQGANRPADPYLTNHYLPGYRPPTTLSHP
jgi:hypothetical protein